MFFGVMSLFTRSPVLRMAWWKNSFCLCSHHHKANLIFFSVTLCLAFFRTFLLSFSVNWASVLQWGPHSLVKTKTFRKIETVNKAFLFWHWVRLKKIFFLSRTAKIDPKVALAVSIFTKVLKKPKKKANSQWENSNLLYIENTNTSVYSFKPP